MELLKLDESPARFQWKDVVILYRTKPTMEDKYNVDTMGTLAKNGKVEFSRAEFWRALVKVFVIGWEGVTENGKPVAYSYEALCRLPSERDNDLMLNLAVAIGQATGFLKSEEERKAEADLKNA